MADIRQCVTRSTAQDFVVVYHIRLLANIRGPFIRAREHTSISLDDWGFFLGISGIGGREVGLDDIGALSGGSPQGYGV